MREAERCPASKRDRETGLLKSMSDGEWIIGDRYGHKESGNSLSVEDSKDGVHEDVNDRV